MIHKNHLFFCKDSVTVAIRMIMSFHKHLEGPVGSFGNILSFSTSLETKNIYDHRIVSDPSIDNSWLLDKIRHCALCWLPLLQIMLIDEEKKIKQV